jgi:hypothetical protein
MPEFLKAVLGLVPKFRARRWCRPESSDLLSKRKLEVVNNLVSFQSVSFEFLKIANIYLVGIGYLLKFLSYCSEVVIE